MQHRNIFNKAVITGLFATVTMTGCDQLGIPAQDRDNVGVNKSACTVLDRAPKAFFGYNNEYDFKNGVVHFRVTNNSATAISFKDIAEDGQARVLEMYKHLEGTACKPPKFSGV